MELLYSIVENPIVLVTILVINTVLMVLFLISTIIAGKGYKELNKRYLSFMSKLSNGENVEGKPTSYVQKLILGEEGTVVNVGFIRDGQPVYYNLTRSRIKTPTVEYEIIDEIGRASCRERV